MTAVRALTIASAKLPNTYVDARNALAKCDRIDECKSWADKAAALASYAKQAEDDQMLVMARRIQLRALERGGELLAAVKAARGGDRGNAATGGRPPVGSRKAMANSAGLSPDQAKTMLRIVNVPPAIRDAMIESAAPPTAQEMADRGKRHIVKPSPHREEWADWVFGVRRLVKIPACGLRVLARHDPGGHDKFLEEARSAQKNLTIWINELEKE
jgi:hypothetical protein